jgi:flagellar motor protein MotB
MALSVQRAHAVKNYLTQVGRVQPQKLVLMGKGETELRTPNAPFAAENRRVQFRRQPH